MYLQKKGNKYWACCPFHSEKTASFVVNADEQYYHCFGCGKSGNVITFLMEHERMSYTEAVETLAREAHMELPEEEDPEVRRMRAKVAKILAANKAAAHFFYSSLKTSAAAGAAAYLDKRNVSPEMRVAFGLGYSPDGYSLAKALEKQGFARETLALAGLTGDDGYDPLAKRLIIPIINAKGEVIGFGGRTLDKDIKPKYRNTKGTPVFDKRKNLFNVNLFKKTQADEKHTSIVLTEGYMDVISLYQAGIHNAVASMGTSLTTEQCSEIKRYVSEVYVCFDGDAAGQGATWRSLDMLKATGLEVRVMSLPDGMDPDDVVNKLGAEGFRDLMKAALPLTEFKIRSLAARQNLNTLHGKEKFALSTLPVLEALDPIGRETHIALVSELSGLSKDSISNSLGDYRSDKAVQSRKVEVQDAETAVKENINSANLNMCRFVLSSVIEGKPYVRVGDFDEGYFTHPVHRAIYAYIAERIDKKDRPPLKGDLFDIAPEDPDEVNAVISATDALPQDKQAEYYAACLARMREKSRKERITEITGKLKTAEGESKSRLEQELLELLKKH